MSKKYTIEYINKFISDGGDILLSEEYLDAYTKLDILCKKCNTPYRATFNSFQQGHRCRKCGRIVAANKKRLKYDYIKEYVESRGDTLISEKYVRSLDKIDILCGTCNKVFDISFCSYQSGIGCHHCSGNQKFTFEFVKNYISECGDILLSSEYIRSNENLEIECGTCGYVWHPCFCSYKNSNSGCPECAKKELSTRFRGDMSMIRDVYKKNNMEILENDDVYVNSQTKLSTRCLICGHIWKTDYNNIANGRNCPVCSMEVKKEKLAARNVTEEYNFSYFNQDIVCEWDYEKNKKLPEEYTPKSEQEVFWICNQCGYKWSATIASRTRGSGCVICGMSGGEKRVYYCLKDLNINFQPQFEFSDLLSDLGNPLRYDFGLLDSFENPFLLVEFDHIQHEKFIPHFHRTLEAFELYQKYDQKKNEYAKDKNIPLLRINYRDFKNIKNILEEALLSLRERRINA